MHWDRLFEDLEDQLASEHEAERAALESESERVRISRIALRERLLSLSERRHPLWIELPGHAKLRGLVQEVGADWLALRSSEPRRLMIIPLAAVVGVGLAQDGVLESLEAVARQASLRERMSLGFVLRDLARRRVPVALLTSCGDDLHGTIDRAGADHLDLALHPRGESRRPQAVTGFRLVPFASLACVQIDPSV